MKLMRNSLQLLWSLIHVFFWVSVSLYPCRLLLQCLSCDLRWPCRLYTECVILPFPCSYLFLHWLLPLVHFNSGVCFLLCLSNLAWGFYVGSCWWKLRSWCSWLWPLSDPCRPGSQHRTAELLLLVLFSWFYRDPPLSNNINLK